MNIIKSFFIDNILKCTMALIVVVIFSCDDNDNVYYANPSKNIAQSISGDMTLMKDNVYELDGVLMVTNGQILRIEQGVRVEAKSKESYIAVAQGGKIYAQGSKEKPIVLTSINKEPGSWGGLVICGKATTNITSIPNSNGSLSEREFTESYIPIKAEVGDLYYGGFNQNEDNSGIISFVRVEYGGYSYSDEKQFNGFSFFGVGSGTKVNNISSYKSGDDGIEFFGGYLDADYVVSIGSGDDGIDFCNGWSGKGNYWYCYDSKMSAIEGSNNETYSDATPVTNANINHVTLYKMGEHPWYLKDGAGSQNVNDLLIGGLPEELNDFYFYYKEEDKMIKKNLNKISFNNVEFFGSIENRKKKINDLKVKEASTSGAGSYTDKNTLEPDWVGSWAVPED